MCNRSPPSRTLQQVASCDHPELRRVTVHETINIIINKKGKAMPVTGNEPSRLPHFLDSRFTDGSEVSLAPRPPFTSRKIRGTNLCHRLSWPRGHSAAGRLGQLKNLMYSRPRSLCSQSYGRRIFCLHWGLRYGVLLKRYIVLHITAVVWSSVLNFIRCMELLSELFYEW
jgi:hypothetical protein